MAVIGGGGGGVFLDIIVVDLAIIVDFYAFILFNSWCWIEPIHILYTSSDVTTS